MLNMDFLFNMLGINKEDLERIIERIKRLLESEDVQEAFKRIRTMLEQIDRIEKKLDALLIAIEDIENWLDGAGDIDGDE